MIKNYDNFFLPASDLAKGRKFYQEILGLPVIILRSHPGVKPSILFEVDDVRATYAELQKRGVVFLSEPYEINTGLAAEFEDPFGNRLGITDYSNRPELSNKGAKQQGAKNADAPRH